MIELNKLVNDVVIELETEGFVKDIVKEQLKKTIKGIVSDTFMEYSDFGKKLKAHINNNINVNLDSLDLKQYNVVILNAVQEQLELAVH